MNRLSVAVILLSVFVIGQSSLFSQEKFAEFYSQPELEHPVFGKWVSSTSAGLLRPETDYAKGSFSPFFGQSFEYILPFSYFNFSLKVQALLGAHNATDLRENPTELSGSISLLNIGTNYYIDISDVFIPYVGYAIGMSWFDPRTSQNQKLPLVAASSDKMNAIHNTVLGGALIMLSSDVGLRLEGGFVLHNSDMADAVRNKQNDAMIYGSAGLVYTLFSPSSTDTDGDGVGDKYDACPNTPHGVKVDEFGCPLDFDRDGIPDYKDSCPNTPVGATVDATGCPIDSDRDGVPNYKDLSPNTPYGVEVDNYGVARDDDLDGVPNYMDICPSTPWAAGVDMYGCAIDSDGDGIPDIHDECPNTARGVLVGDTGCPLLTDSTEMGNIPEESGDVYTNGTHFVIQVSAWRTLDKALHEADKYIGSGLPAYVIMADIPEKGGVWYRVRIGEFKTVKEAEEFAKKIKTHEYIIK